MILIVAFVSLFTSALLSYSHLKKSNEQANIRLFDSINSNVEQAVSDVAAVYTYIINSSDTGPVLALNKYKDYFNTPYAQNFSKSLRSYTTNDISYFIYIQETDTIIAPDGIYESNYYYKTISSGYNVSYDEWINGIVNNSYTLLKGTDGGNSVQYNMSYSNGKRLYLAAIIKSNRILNTKNDEEWISDCNIYIKEKNGKTILKLNDAGDKNSGKTDVYTARVMFFTTSANLVIECPRVVFLQPLAGYLKGIGLLSLLFIVLNVVLAFYSAKKSYKPIGSILSLLGIKEENSQFGDISESIKSLLNEKNLNRELSNKLTNLQKGKEIEDLISCMTKPRSYEYIKSKITNGNVVNINSEFYLFSLETENIKRLFEKSKISDEQRYMELLFILDNISCEIFGDKNYKCGIFCADEYILGIVSHKEAERIEEKAVKELLEKTVQSVREFFEVSLTYVLSGKYENAGKLSEAYAEIKYLVQYKSIMKIRDSLCAADIKYDFSNNMRDIFDVDIERKFINNISSGNSAEAIFILDTIFDRLRESNLPLAQMKFIISDVSYSFYKISSDLVLEEEKEALNSFLTKMYFEENLNECYKLLCNFINAVCVKLVQKNAPITKRSKVDECLIYIKDNYSGPYLNLNVVSMELNMDSGYLSKNFKEQVGCSFNDYLTRLRIEHAKNALRNTSLSVNNIYLESGFTNLRTFNRVFKKYEGVTPTDFRNSAF